jgi:hypothetical protein
MTSLPVKVMYDAGRHHQWMQPAPQSMPCPSRHQFQCSASALAVNVLSNFTSTITAAMDAQPQGGKRAFRIVVCFLCIYFLLEQGKMISTGSSQHHYT